MTLFFRAHYFFFVPQTMLAFGFLNYFLENWFAIPGLPVPGVPKVPKPRYLAPEHADNLRWSIDQKSVLPGD